jgi:hypothetical protein
MKTATLVHVETGVEYYKDGSLFTPSANEKLLWSMFGMPNGVERFEETFETEIDELVGFTKKEVQSKCDQNFRDGLYSFLPAMGYNQRVELRYGI